MQAATAYIPARPSPRASARMVWASMRCSLPFDCINCASIKQIIMRALDSMDLRLGVFIFSVIKILVRMFLLNITLPYPLNHFADILPVDLFDPVDAHGDVAIFASLHFHDIDRDDSRAVRLGNP